MGVLLVSLDDEEPAIISLDKLLDIKVDLLLAMWPSLIKF